VPIKTGYVSKNTDAATVFLAPFKFIELGEDESGLCLNESVEEAKTRTKIYVLSGSL